jgi:hypothetical protein
MDINDRHIGYRMWEEVAQKPVTDFGTGGAEPQSYATGYLSYKNVHQSPKHTQHSVR